MPLLSTKEAAEALKISVKTLRGHVRDGAIRYIVTGRGKKRPGIAFAQSDLEEFEERQRRRSAPPCQSGKTNVQDSTSTISGGEVIAFSEVLERDRSAKRGR